MHVKVIQEVTLIFSKELEYNQSFREDPDWKLINEGSMAVTYRKTLKDDFAEYIAIKKKGDG